MTYIALDITKKVIMSALWQARGAVPSRAANKDISCIERNMMHPIQSDQGINLYLAIAIVMQGEERGGGVGQLNIQVKTTRIWPVLVPMQGIEAFLSEYARAKQHYDLTLQQYPSVLLA